MCKSRISNWGPQAPSYSQCSFLASGNIYDCYGVPRLKNRRVMLILRGPSFSGLGIFFSSLWDFPSDFCITRNLDTNNVEVPSNIPFQNGYRKYEQPLPKSTHTLSRQVFIILLPHMPQIVPFPQCMVEYQRVMANQMPHTHACSRKFGSIDLTSGGPSAWQRWNVRGVQGQYVFLLIPLKEDWYELKDYLAEETNLSLNYLGL